MTANTPSTPLTTASEPILSVENLCVSLSGKQVLYNVNLKLHPQEIISVIGPNGGGKSTLIKTIAGLVSPASGSIRKKHSLQVGYVPQNFAVPDSLPLRVTDFLNLVQHQRKMFKPRLTTHHKTCEGLHEKIIEQFSLQPLLNSQMHSLSGGQLQRVLLANALLSQPDIVMLDEPMQGLDPETQANMYALVRQLPAYYGSAVLIVSHDLHWVMQGTDHVICINQHICCEGMPADIQSESAFQNLYNHQYPFIHVQNSEHVGETFYTHHHHCEHEHDCSTHH